ncbi:MAG: FecR domain-containing protein [Bacteroidota bacterium]
MQQPSPDVLDRYFKHNCTQEEAERVLKWLATPPGQQFYKRYLEQQIEQPSPPQLLGVQIDVDKSLRETHNRIHQREAIRRRKRWLSIAAAVTMLLLGTWLSVTLTNSYETTETAFGQTQNITLADGTLIKLNANSSLRYQTDNPREVWLAGEAFFQVSHTLENETFRVHTSDLTVNVLGTTFNVHTRHEQTSVVLSEGEVTLELADLQSEETVRMLPGDKISFSQSTKALKKSNVNPETHIAWAQGTVHFDHTPLREVFTLLEDTYGVQVNVTEPSLLDEELSGQVDLQLDIILTLLQKSFNLKITQEDNAIMVHQ